MRVIITILLAGAAAVVAGTGCDREVAGWRSVMPWSFAARAGQQEALDQQGGATLRERMARWLRREPTTSELESVQQHVRDILNAPAAPAYVRPEDPRAWKLLARFYESRAQQPAWVASQGRSEQIEGLFRALARSDRDAIDPALHDLPALRELEQRARSTRGGVERAAALADLDVRLTYEFIRYHSHLHGGRINPSDVNTSWPHAVSRTPSDSLLDVVLQEGRVEQSLGTDGFPQGYVRLRDALAVYREIAADGEWPRITVDKLSPRDNAPEVAVLRARLAATGDLEGAASQGAPDTHPSGDGEAVLYDEAITAAVTRFQARHGLETDGIAGPQTIAQLNVPVAERVRQIELNMERWRWLPDDLSDRYIEVNVPAFELRAYEAGHAALSMKVVAGDEFHPTPVFSDKMTYVVFRPYWTIPVRIALEEKLPEILKDRDFLERDQLEVVKTSRKDAVIDPSRVPWSELAEQQMAGYSLRQKPGKRNSLGLVKFMFPNEFNVYLHDTPAAKFFSREDRALSHGCVRVEKPALLAEFVLRGNDGWSRERIDAAMAGEETQTVSLAQPVPVHIVYWTAFVDDEGTLQFRDDVYGIDEAMEVVSVETMEAALR